MPSYTASQPENRTGHVPPGGSAVEVIDAIETVSKKGHDIIELKLKTNKGSILYDYLVFTPTAFWKIDSFRGATGDDVRPGEDVEIHADDLIGRTATARLTVEEFNGSERNKVGAWLIADGGENNNTNQKGANHAARTNGATNNPF